MTDFATSVQAFVDKAKGNIDRQVRGITLSLFRDVIMSSPVGNRELWTANIKRAGKGLPPLPKGYAGGMFRGNWQTTVGAPAVGAIDRIDPSGAQATAEVIATVPKQAGSIVYLTNNLPYAQVLEYEGHSHQAPNGMVRIALARIASNVESSE